MKGEQSVSELFEMAGKLLYYPYDSIRGPLDSCQCELNKGYPEIAKTLEPFAEYVASVSNTRLEELYIQTFEVQAVCCLDVGYALFGEDYKRGQFMAQIKELHRMHEIDCGSELPDFLPNILKLLGRLPEEDARLLVSSFVYPATEKMVNAFEASKNVYQLPLIVVRDLLRTVYVPQVLPVLKNREDHLCTT